MIDPKIVNAVEKGKDAYFVMNPIGIVLDRGKIFDKTLR